MTDLDAMFEEQAEQQRKAADAADADPIIQAQRAAKRADEIAREIRQGVRDADGDLILSDDETPECDDDETDEPED